MYKIVLQVLQIGYCLMAYAAKGKDVFSLLNTSDFYKEWYWYLKTLLYFLYHLTQ